MHYCIIIDYCNNYFPCQILIIAIINNFFEHYCYCYCNKSVHYWHRSDSNQCFAKFKWTDSGAREPFLLWQPLTKSFGKKFWAIFHKGNSEILGRQVPTQVLPAPGQTTWIMYVCTYLCINLLSHTMTQNKHILLST